MKKQFYLARTCARRVSVSASRMTDGGGVTAVNVKLLERMQECRFFLSTFYTPLTSRRESLSNATRTTFRKESYEFAKHAPPGAPTLRQVNGQCVLWLFKMTNE